MVVLTGELLGGQGAGGAPGRPPAARARERKAYHSSICTAECNAATTPEYPTAHPLERRWRKRQLQEQPTEVRSRVSSRCSVQSQSEPHAGHDAVKTTASGWATRVRAPGRP